MEVSHPHFFDIFKKYKGFQTGKIKLKKPRQLQEVLDVARMLVKELKSGSQTQIICEKMTKLEQLKTVLEMYGHFSGKPFFKQRIRNHNLEIKLTWKYDHLVGNTYSLRKNINQGDF